MNVYGFMAGLISGMQSCAQRRSDQKRAKEHQELMNLLQARLREIPEPPEPEPAPEEPEPEPLINFFYAYGKRYAYLYCACGERFTFDDDFIRRHRRKRLKVTCKKCGHISWIKSG
jgi:hypothetical protein